MTAGILAAALWSAVIGTAAPGEPRLLVRPVIASDEAVVYTHNLVTDYGADNSGREDCTAKIQQALDAAAADDGGIVFAPAGRYRILGHLTVPPGVTFMGRVARPRRTSHRRRHRSVCLRAGCNPLSHAPIDGDGEKARHLVPRTAVARSGGLSVDDFWADEGSWHGIEDVTFYNS